MPTTPTTRFIKIDGQFVRPGSAPASATGSVPGMGTTDPNAMGGAAPMQPSINSLPGNPFETGDFSQVNDAPTAFNVLLFDLLKRAQGVDTTGLLQRKRALQRAAIGESDNSNVSDIKTLSPGQQDSIRSGNANALQPEIDQNAADIARSDEAMKNFETIYGQAQGFGKDFAENMVAPDSVIEHYKKAIEANPDNLQVILSGVNDKTRNKIIQSLDYSKLGKKTGEDPNRTLTISEAKDLGVAYGTTVGQAMKMGVVPGGGNGVSPDVQKQDELDKQTIKSNYQQIQSIASSIGKTPETLTEQDIAGLSNTDYDTISGALARMQKFDISRTGGDAGSALGATSFSGKANQYLTAGIGGQKFLPSEVLSGVKTAVNIAKGRNITGGGSSNTFRVKLANGQTGTINASEFDPSTMTKI